MYTPVDGYEVPFSPGFLNSVEERLKELRGTSKSLCFGVELDQSALLLESTYQLPDLLLQEFKSSKKSPHITLSDIKFPPRLDIANFITSI